MGKNNICTTDDKYTITCISIVLVAILAGCSGDFSPINESSTGFFNQLIVYPFSQLITWVAVIFQGSYGMSIVALTITLRLMILPFTAYQMKQGTFGKEKMAVMKPEMDAIQKAYEKEKSIEKQMAMQQELSALYKKYNYHPLRVTAGCIPMLLQMPVLIGFYYAIRRTPEIANQSFLWFDLGGFDFGLLLIAVLIYFIQSRVSLIGLKNSERKQAAFMGLASPIMIGAISFTMPAALPLYWSVGGLFMIAQTVMLKMFFS